MRKESSNPEDEQNEGEAVPRALSRRDLLAGTAATIASAFIPAASMAAADKPGSTGVFTSDERRSLEAAVSRIIPATEQSPGALEAGCARYIETALADAYRTLQTTYQVGLAALNRYANSQSGKSFAALDSDQQDKVLSDFEHNAKVGDYTGSGAFFELLRRHTLEGMFGDPLYGGNSGFAGWDLIGYPGVRMFVKPEMQKMDAKISPSGFSVQQLDHGSH